MIIFWLLVLRFSTGQTRSSDVNHIENLWIILDHSVYDQNRQFEYIDDLGDVIEAVWDRIGRRGLKRTVDWMPDRLMFVIEKRVYLLSTKSDYLCVI